MKLHVASGWVLVAMLSVGVSACGAGDGEANNGLGVHLELTDEAGAANAGLPTYPGSKPYRDSDDSSSSANVGFSTPLVGFKVVAVNLEAADRPQQVAAFYRKALAKFGDVLECSDDAAGKGNATHSDGLACESDEPGTHSVVYKVGTKENQHIVAIKPHGSGTRFSVVHVDVRGKQ